MSQQNNIEQIFKDAFQDFSPEVSPKVWNAVSQQIATPALPLSQPTTTVAKTVATKLSSAGLWIAGGIVATLITIGVVMDEPKEVVEQGVKTVVPSSALVENNEDAVEAFVANTIVDNQNKTAVSTENESVKNQDHNPTTVADKSTNTGIATGEYSETNEANTQQPQSAKALSTTETSTEKQQQTVASNQATESKTESVNTAAVEQIAPLILTNSTAGFAPLQIAGLLNKEKVKGDWDFGDGSTAQLNSNSVTHQYTKPGTYKMQCNLGETSIEKTIEVIGVLNTAFSPNGDGINDYFFVEAADLNQFSLRIIDRNGRKVAELKNAHDKWDGRLANGELAQTGTYFYELTAITATSKEINQRGAVSLFR